MEMVSGDAIRLRRYHSPYGDLLLGAYGGQLCLADWVDVPGRRGFVVDRLRRVLGADVAFAGSEATDCAAAQLDEYFAGRRRVFDVPLLLVGTEFQEAVWRRLAEVGYGETVPYAELARRVGRPRAVRAVAAACRANAVSIIVPCHRVVGSDGSLTGYAGGLEAKMSLLSLELSQM